MNLINVVKCECEKGHDEVKKKVILRLSEIPFSSHKDGEICSGERGVGFKDSYVAQKTHEEV